MFSLECLFSKTAHNDTFDATVLLPSMIDFVACHIDSASNILCEQEKSPKLQGCETLFPKVTEVNQDMMLSDVIHLLLCCHSDS